MDYLTPHSHCGEIPMSSLAIHLKKLVHDSAFLMRLNSRRVRRYETVWKYGYICKRHMYCMYLYKTGGQMK